MKSVLCEVLDGTRLTEHCSSSLRALQLSFPVIRHTSNGNAWTPESSLNAFEVLLQVIFSASCLHFCLRLDSQVSISLVAQWNGGLCFILLWCSASPHLMPLNKNHLHPPFKNTHKLTGVLSFSFLHALGDSRIERPRKRQRVNFWLWMGHAACVRDPSLLVRKN